ncbi:MAG: OsmC family protein [Candidatus Thermoplasmatota archaeon]|nr:OsmC family protein [Candidatus Thermoplasmatota archaeon]
MASSIRVKGLAFAGLTDSGKWVTMDTSEQVGGITGGPAPMEMVLQALMGCTGMDVVSILEKMKVTFTSFEVREEHERSLEHPKVYTSIHLVYAIEGEEVDPEKVKKAVSLSMDRYCAVSAMLRSSVRIHHDIEINGKSIE